MRIAKDGKPFDVDNLPDNGNSDEVEIIQYLRPNGRRRRMLAQVGEEIAKLAQNLIITAEELSGMGVSITIRKQGEPEENELIDIANNGPGENSPTNVIIKLIKRINK